MNKVAAVVLFDVRVKSPWRCKEETNANMFLNLNILNLIVKLI